MSKRNAVEVEKLYSKWKLMLYRSDFRELTRTEQAKIIGVSNPTITKWKQGLNQAQWDHILRVSRQAIAEKSVKIDDALARKAEGGDVNAIKLWKESMEGWSPKQNLEVTRGKDPDLTPEQTEQAIKDALALLPVEKRGEILSSLSSLPPPPEKKEVTLSDLVAEDERNGKFLP